MINSYGIYGENELMPHYELYWGADAQEKAINEVVRNIFTKNNINCTLLDISINDSISFYSSLDVNFFKELIEISPLMFKFFPEHMRKNIELVEFTIDKLKFKSYMFFTIAKYLPHELLKNNYLVEKILKINGRNLFYIKNKNKRQILLAIKSDGLSIKYLPKKFHNCNIFYFIAQKENKKSIIYFGSKIYTVSLLRKLVINNLENYENLPKKLREKSRIYSIVNKNMVSLSYLPYCVRNNKEEVLDYIRANFGNYNYASNLIRENKKFILEIYKIYPILKNRFPVGLSEKGLNSEVVKSSILLDQLSYKHNMYELKDETISVCKILYNKDCLNKNLKTKVKIKNNYNKV